MTTTTEALRAALRDRFGETIDLPADLAGGADIDELLRIAGYTTHRNWSPTPVSPQAVKFLAACALAAPTKSYLQQADIIDVRDAAKRAAVVELVPSMPWMANAPVLLVFCGNGRRFRRIFARRGQPFTNEHLDAFFNPAVDAALVMMNFIRAAAASGLACCPISVLRDRAARLAEILELPDHVFPVAGLCAGFPAQVRGINPRLGLSATLHVDRYDDSLQDAAMDEFDQRYVTVRAAFAGGAQISSWSEEKLKQYAAPQRADWGEFVEGRKFKLK